MNVMNALCLTLLVGMTGVLSILLPSLILARYFWIKGDSFLVKAFFHVGRFLFVMPPLIAVFCFMDFFPGRLGIWAIAAVHAYLLLPYCAERFLQGYRSYILESYIKQSALLRLSFLRQVFLIEVPALRAEVVHTGLLTFLMTSTAFSTVLLLGGGPDVSTLTLSIFAEFEQGFRGRHIFVLMGAQGSLSFVLILFLRQISTSKRYTVNKPNMLQKRSGSIFVSLILVGFYVAPLISFLPYISLLEVPNGLVQSSLLTLFLGGGSAFLIVIFVLALISYALTKEKSFLKTVDQTVFLLWSVPKILLVSCVFMTMLFWYDYVLLSLGAMLFLFLLCYLPYAWNAFMGFARDIEERYKRQMTLLRLSPWGVFSYLIWRPYKQVILKNLATLCCFVMGNLLVFLFMFPDSLPVKPLSLLGYEAMVRFDMEGASYYLGAQLVLMLFVILLPALFYKKEKSC